MLKSKLFRKGEKGFTLIELLVVAAIIGILLAIAIPNLIKARISANEANGRKSMQTLRDAEGEYFEQDLDNDGKRDFTELVGTDATDNSLRCPDTADDCVTNPENSLIDKSFEGADSGGSGQADCVDSKSGYCVEYAEDASTAVLDLEGDFGWQGSMSSAQKTGRKDFSVYGDGAIRCTATTVTTGTPGTYEALRATAGCD